MRIGTDPVNGQVEVPAGGQLKVPTPCGDCSGAGAASCPGSSVAHAVGLAGGDHGGDVVQEPVEEADGGGVFGQESAPVNWDQWEAMPRDRRS